MKQFDTYKYPVLALPNDVVSEIFIHALFSLPAPIPAPPSPTILAQICHKWRDIALSTPALWKESI
jgi:hypothetical protein